MLKQTEGSHAVAEAVALCRPEVICAYPISPQTHIVEGLGEMVKSGALAPCEFLNVESEFAAMSVAIGASAAGARTYTATASQGLLFMAEAVYNASGLGLPIVMTVANRAIGAPINIWNDHSDAMSDARLRLDPALCRNQPGGARPAHPGLQARRGALDAGDGVHGRLHPHPRLRAGRHSRAVRGRRFLPPYEPRQVLDPAEPVSIGAMVGPEAFMEVRYLAHAKQLSGARSDPAHRRGVCGSLRAQVGRARARLQDRRRRDDRRCARLGARHVQGHRRRIARQRREHRRRSASSRSGRSRSPRCVRR